MRALLHAATDEPRPEGESDIFLRLYKEIRCWNENRRGPFPFDMTAWRWARIGLDEMEMVRLCPFSFLNPILTNVYDILIATDRKRNGCDNSVTLKIVYASSISRAYNDTHITFHVFSGY